MQKKAPQIRHAAANRDERIKEGDELIPKSSFMGARIALEVRKAIADVAEIPESKVVLSELRLIAALIKRTAPEEGQKPVLEPGVVCEYGSHSVPLSYSRQFFYVKESQ